ncbi:MAG: protein kinase [Thermoanaerobaculia bacterium]
MSEKSRLAALLTRDHQQLAEIHLREGRKDKALDLFARAGSWKQAGRLALELRQVPRAVELFLSGALGSAAEAYRESAPTHAAQLLLSAGHAEEALLLFEAAGAWPQAAMIAARLRDLPRAASHYERAREYEQAALYYERIGRFDDALRVLEAQARQLVQSGARAGASAEAARRDLDLRRAEILARLGRSQEAVALLRAWKLMGRAARLLEKAGEVERAIDAYLEAGEAREARRLVGRARGLDPRILARVHLESGDSAQAARILASLGEAREAAAAFETAGDLPSAAQQWQACREFDRAAQAWKRAGRFAEAGRCFELGGNAAQAAECLARAGEAGAAATAYVQAGRYLEASRHFLAVGDRSQAARALQQVAVGGSEFEPATLLLVPLLLEEGLPGAALQRLRMLSPAAGGGLEANLERLYWEGRANEALGKRDEAASAYQKLIALRRDHRDAPTRLVELGRQAASAPPPQPGAEPTRLEPRSPVSGIRPGTLLAGRYEIRAELGRGGMGCVYRAFDRELGDQVAIKTLLEGPERDGKEEERLLREVQICRRITHPNVVRVFDIGRMDGGLFVTMELLEGVGLDTLIGRGKQLSLARVRSVLTEVLAGLAEAHALEVVHRDLKPSNLFLTSRHLKILDFGIARMAEGDPRLTRTGFAVGTPLYMSPEQIRGELLDGRSDLYSLGVLTFTLLAGREPFLGPGAAAIVLDHLQAPPPNLLELRPELPLPWKALVEKLMAKSPEERFPDARTAAFFLAKLPIS